MINLDKKQIAIGIVIVVGMVAIIGYYFYTTLKSDDDTIEIVATNTVEEEKKEETEDKEEATQIIVHIAGEVANAGIIKIEEGARIADVIEKAGGLTEQADITNINLAYPVEDGQKITIPKVGQVENSEQEYITTGSGTNDDNATTNSTSKININKATSEELQTLSGIGESTAEKIINYRKENGDFKQIEDIKNVPGIGDSKFNITVK
jgi:competence protein ComEA